MMLESVIEPVVLVFKANQHTCRFPVSSDKDFLGLSKAKKSREVVLDLSQRCLAHRASRARQPSGLLRLS